MTESNIIPNFKYRSWRRIAPNVVVNGRSFGGEMRNKKTIPVNTLGNYCNLSIVISIVPGLLIVIFLNLIVHLVTC